MLVKLSWSSEPMSRWMERIGYMNFWDKHAHSPAPPPTLYIHIQNIFLKNEEVQSRSEDFLKAYFCKGNHKKGTENIKLCPQNRINMCCDQVITVRGDLWVKESMVTEQKHSITRHIFSWSIKIVFLMCWIQVYDESVLRVRGILDWTHGTKYQKTTMSWNIVPPQRKTDFPKFSNCMFVTFFQMSSYFPVL